VLRAVLAVVSVVLILGTLASLALARPTPLATPTPLPTASPEPTPVPRGQLYNCPPANRWSIAVWDGLEDTPTGEALATCGQDAVSAAYSLDSDTQGWWRYFPDHLDISNIGALDDMQGILLLGGTGITTPTATPAPSAIPSPSPKPEEVLTVHFIDVGQGDAILIARGDTGILVDGGPTSANVLPYLQFQGVGDIDLMVATHPHADHIGGTPKDAVISVGAGNTYGDPAQETLDRVAAAGANVYRTDLDGNVVLTSDCHSYSIITRVPPPFEGQQGVMHNCPKPGKWGIAVWDGGDGVYAPEAFTTCGEDAVEAAYALDPHTQEWLRWFAAYPEVSDLQEVGNLQGIMALGRAPAPATTATPTPSRTPATYTPIATATATPTHTPAPTPTPAPALGGRIAFTSYRDGNGEIYVMNADGSTQTRLTNNPSDDYNPAWSPDGSKIAFVSERDGNGEVYVMNADGSHQTNLTDSLGYDGDAAWAPDGSKIAFGSNRDGDLEIYVMDADGSHQTNLTSNPADDYLSTNWSPNSGRTAFWSPDGSKIAFWSTRDGDLEIYVMDSDGSRQTRLTYSPGDDQFPAWSPDGSKIAFYSERDGNPEVYVMNADGSQQLDLTNNPAYDYFFAWSPDSSQIAFASDRQSHGEVYLMNADGSQQTNLTNNPAYDWDAAWSPDGSKIAFYSTRDGSGEVYLMNADGSQQTRLTDSPADDGAPAWAPSP